MAVRGLCHAILGSCLPEYLSNATRKGLLSLTPPASSDELSMGGVRRAADVPACPREHL